MNIKTRFAPSPTGFLHIGGIRTALYNYIFAKQNLGQYFIRIEDTDKERSTKKAVDAILDGLNWLKINSDFPIIFQSKNIDRHKEIVDNLLKINKAYKCYLSIEDQEKIKIDCIRKGIPFKSPWRNKKSTNQKSFVVRLKMPETGGTEVKDLIQGNVSINNSTLDDMVILRSDGSPTYMLAVVVDDHDMGITHIIRGDDHLNNTFRQIWVYHAMDWKIPIFAHIPLIHGEDGKKLSKRHGAVGIDFYKNEGFLPEALNSYLLNIGWGTENENEFIDLKQAIKIFNLKFLGRSPSRFDFKRLYKFNSFFIKKLSFNQVQSILKNEFKDKININTKKLKIALPTILKRSSNTKDLTQESKWIFCNKLNLNPKDLSIISEENFLVLDAFKKDLKEIKYWNHSEVKKFLDQWLEKNNLKLKDIGPGLRICLTGKINAPDLIDILIILGPKEIIKRIDSWKK